MKIEKYFILLSILLCFATAEIKIGYVDSNEIMSNFEEVRHVQVYLEKEQRRLESEFNSFLLGIEPITCTCCAPKQAAARIRNPRLPSCLKLTQQRLIG